MVWRKYFLSTFSLKTFVLSDSLFVTRCLNGLNNAIHSFFEMHSWIIPQNNYRVETFSSDYCSIYKEKQKHCGKASFFLSFMAHFVNRWIGWTGHFGSTGRLCYLLIAQFSVWFPASDFKVFFLATLDTERQQLSMLTPVPCMAEYHCMDFWAL